MNKKEKTPAVLVRSREELESAVSEVARLKIQYAAAKTGMELEIARVQARHEEELQALSQRIEAQESGVFAFCQENRGRLFEGKKSIEFCLATIGFRLEPPSVTRRSKKETWPAIARKLQSFGWGARYVVIPPPEVDKKALLADRDRLSPDQLGQAGLRFAQDEVFYITPKFEGQRTVLEAA